MSDETETTVTSTVKAASDGMVKITVEKYNELLEEIGSQKGTISSLNTQINRLRDNPPIINRTVVNKTPEMLAQEHVAWGGTLMGAGASMFVVGAIRYRLGMRIKA